MGEWRETSLGKLVDIKHGFAFKGELIESEANGVMLTTPGNFSIGGGWKEERCKYYSGPIPADYVLKGGELVVTMTDLSKEVDTLGYSAIIPSESNTTYLHNQRIGLVELITEDADKSYLYWLMRDREYRGHIVASASGSTVSHTSPTRIKEYEFLLPPLAEQKAIAAVLSSLDDKIDLLHRQNKTLEALAETLFRQWFVEEAQEDWAEGTVSDLFVLQRGFDLPTQNRIPGPFPIFAASGHSGGHVEPRVKGPGVTTGRSGLLGKVFYVMEDFWPLNTSLFIKEFKIGAPLFSYFLLKSIDLEGFNAGSAVPTLNRNHVHEYGIQIPPKELIEEFEQSMSANYEKIRSNESQIALLEKLRDTLLPKLMSGEVRVGY